MNPQPIMIVLDEPGPYLSLIVKCSRCEAVVSRRRFDTREPDAVLHVDLSALVDGEAWLAHACRTQ